MESLIGYCFLKQFLGNRLHGHRAIPASEGGNPTDDQAENATQPGDFFEEDSLEKQASQDMQKTGEPNKPSE